MKFARSISISLSLSLFYFFDDYTLVLEMSESTSNLLCANVTQIE